MEPPPAPTHALGTESVITDARRRTLVLAAVCLALVAVVASVSGLSVAQPALALELGATQNDLLWIINGYTIALAALLLPIGAVGDRWGRKKVLVSGLAIFVLANLAAVISGDVTQLLVARIVAGVAAAMIMPATLSIITSSFPSESRDRAVGIWAGFAGAGGILGLVGSALVVDHFTWQWVFAMPIALAVPAFVLSLVYAPNTREHSEHRFDTLGAILSAAGIGALVLGIHEGPEQGWTAPIALGALIVGVAALVAFVVWELRHENPLLNPRLFRHRMLTSGSVSLVVGFGILAALFLVLVQFLQAVLGYSAVRAALSLLPMAAAIMPLATVSPRITARVGTRVMFVSGAGLTTLGLAMMALMASPDGYLSVLPGLLIVGAGAGMLMTPGTTAITRSLPVEEQGVASALNDTARELGGAIGMALIGSVLSSAYTSNVTSATSGLPAEAASTVQGGIGGAVAVAGELGDVGTSVLHSAQAAFVDAWQTCMWLSAGVALAAAVFALVWTPSRAKEMAEETFDLDAFPDDMVPELVQP